MTIAHQGTPTTAVGTGTTCTLSTVATPAKGDVIVAAIAVDTVVAFTDPAGMQRVYTQPDSTAGNDQILGMWIRHCLGNEAANYAWTFASNAFSGGMVLLRESDPERIVVFDRAIPGQSGAGTNIANPGITTADDNEMLVGAFAGDLSPSGAVTHTAPGTMTERVDVNSASWAAIEICTELFATKGATGTRTAVASAAHNGGMSILASFRSISNAEIFDYSKFPIQSLREDFVRRNPQL